MIDFLYLVNRSLRMFTAMPWAGWGWLGFLFWVPPIIFALYACKYTKFFYRMNFWLRLVLITVIVVFIISLFAAMIGLSFGGFSGIIGFVVLLISPFYMIKAVQGYPWTIKLLSFFVTILVVLEAIAIGFLFGAQ